MPSRNRLIHLLELYELLLSGPQTFNSIRNGINIGYHSLKTLIDKLLEKELIYEVHKEERLYYPTEKLVKLFENPLYDSLNRLRDI